jgi:uncharacterized protein
MLQGADPDATVIHKMLDSFIKFFFEGKFYILFSLLFGYGFWLFIHKSVPDGKSILPIFLRRVFILLLFGAIHIVFLWAGDILFFYAIFGFILVLFRRVSDKGIVKWAVWLALVPSIITGMMVLMFFMASRQPDVKEMFEANIHQSMLVINNLIEVANNFYSQGTLAEIIVIRLKEWRMLLPGFLFFYPIVMSMFLMGVWIARKGIIERFNENLSFFRKTIWLGILVGIPANLLYVLAIQNANPTFPNQWSLIATFFSLIGGLSFCLLYVSTIIILTSRNSFSKFGQMLPAVGRMALTNYLLHSIICAFLFHPYGFGLFGKIEIWHGIILTIVIYGLQIPFSNWWLKHFNFGPFEWLWRSLTYLKLQPFVK